VTGVQTCALPIYWQQQQQHGELDKWLRCVAQLPQLPAEQVSLGDTITVSSSRVTAGEQNRIRRLLMQLTPWRKGPFNLHGVHVDTEWRSDFKWQRLLPHISDLTGRHVLDIGCGRSEEHT